MLLQPTTLNLFQDTKGSLSRLDFIAYFSQKNLLKDVSLLFACIVLHNAKYFAKDV